MDVIFGACAGEPVTARAAMMRNQCCARHHKGAGLWSREWCLTGRSGSNLQDLNRNAPRMFSSMRRTFMRQRFTGIAWTLWARKNVIFGNVPTGLGGSGGTRVTRVHSSMDSIIGHWPRNSFCPGRSLPAWISRTLVFRTCLCLAFESAHDTTLLQSGGTISSGGGSQKLSPWSQPTSGLANPARAAAFHATWPCLCHSSFRISVSPAISGRN